MEKHDGQRERHTILPQQHQTTEAGPQPGLPRHSAELVRGTGFWLPSEMVPGAGSARDWCPRPGSGSLLTAPRFPLQSGHGSTPLLQNAEEFNRGYLDKGPRTNWQKLKFMYLYIYKKFMYL